MASNSSVTVAPMPLCETAGTDFVNMIDVLKREMCPMKMLRLTNTLEEMEDFGEMFTFFWSFDEVHKCLNLPAMPMGKSQEDALLLRVEGNCLYKEKRYEEALEYYNQSIVLSPHPDMTDSGSDEDDNIEYKTLADGYVNRSANLYVLKEFDKCLDDLDLASRYMYTDLMAEKIVEKRQQCFRAKERFLMNPKPLFISNNTKTPPEIVEPNKSFPNFSDAVKIEYSSKIGRHVVARRNIRPGEVIAVEKCYCSRIFHNAEHIFCPACLMPCPMPVPCPSCSLVSFCSNKCRKEGLKDHMRECRIIPYMDLFGLSNRSEASLALLTLIQATFVVVRDSFPRLQKEAKELPPEKLGLNKEGIYKSDEYRAAFHLANKRRKVFCGNSLFNICAQAYIMTRMLLDSGTFYVDKSGKRFTPSHSDLMITGTALLHHMCIFPNVFGLSDMIVNTENNKTFKKVIGEAVFPALMSIRHSCNAPTVHYTFGRYRIVRACSPISAGEEVTLCYGGKYQSNSFEFRRLHLQNFGIFCKCEACEDEWPCFLDLPDELRLKCIRCNKSVTGDLDAPSCNNCNIEYSKTKFKGEKRAMCKKFFALADRVREADKNFYHINDKINQDRMTMDDFKGLCYYVEVLHRYVAQPCMAMTRGRDAMLAFFYKDNKFAP